uniref:Histocompatibility minor 13 n=1 Tax=Anser cygnoides TaxID=8845 RepID=A0A8B9IFQ7_ANSCY
MPSLVTIPPRVNWVQEEGAALPLLALGESLNPISLLTEGSQMLSLWRGLAEGEGLARSAGCSRVVWLRARLFAREDSPFWGHERRAPWCCPAVNSPCAGREAAGPAPRLTSLFCRRNSELRVRHQGPRMSGPEQRCRGLVPAEEGERAAALLGGRAGTGLGQTGAPFPHRAPAAWLCTCRGTHLSLLCPPQHWIANNLFGLAFSLNGVELLHLNNVSTGCILLGGLFIYDVFWVFGTNVMVTVAKSFEAPIKLVFPQDLLEKGLEADNFAMLGLGDIVIPGIFIALLLRFDISLKKNTHTYFYTSFVAYIFGLGLTIFIMHIFKHAQPALLYLVPACIGFPLLVALAKGEVTEMFSYEESSTPKEAPGASKEEPTAADKKEK